jgi:hypothetical protein
MSKNSRTPIPNPTTVTTNPNPTPVTTNTIFSFGEKISNESPYPFHFHARLPVPVRSATSKGKIRVTTIAGTVPVTVPVTVEATGGATAAATVAANPTFFKLKSENSSETQQFPPKYWHSYSKPVVKLPIPTRKRKAPEPGELQTEKEAEKETAEKRDKERNVKFNELMEKVGIAQLQMLEIQKLVNELRTIN